MMVSYQSKHMYSKDFMKIAHGKVTVYSFLLKSMTEQSRMHQIKNQSSVIIAPGKFNRRSYLVCELS